MTSLIRIASVRAGLGLALLVATSCTWAQTPELARAAATHQSLTQARTQEDRLALHDQLQGLWSEALTAGKMLEVEWENFNNAVVDLGETAAWGGPTGVSLAPDGRSFVLGQRRQAGGGVEERLLTVHLDCR